MADHSTITRWLQHQDEEVLYSADTDNMTEDITASSVREALGRLLPRVQPQVPLAITEAFQAKMERRRVALETIMREGQAVVRSWTEFGPEHGCMDEAVERLAQALALYQ